MIEFLRNPDALLSLFETCIKVLGPVLGAVAVAWINRKKPPRLPPVLIPIVLLLSGALSGLALSRPALARLFAPSPGLEAKTCGDECTKKSGCSCSADQCRCASVDAKPRMVPEPVKPPDPKKPPSGKPPKPTSSLAIMLPTFAGRPHGWFVEPVQSQPH